MGQKRLCANDRRYRCRACLRLKARFFIPRKKFLERIRMKNRRVYKVLLCGIVFLFFLFAFVGCEALFGNNIQEDVNVKLTLSNYDEYFSFTTRREQTGTTVLPYVTYREMNGVYQDAEYHNVVIKVSVPQTYGDDEIRNYTANIGGYCSFAWSDTYSIIGIEGYVLFRHEDNQEEIKLTRTNYEVYFKITQTSERTNSIVVPRIYTVTFEKALSKLEFRNFKISISFSGNSENTVLELDANGSLQFSYARGYTVKNVEGTVVL